MNGAWNNRPLRPNAAQWIGLGIVAAIVALLFFVFATVGLIIGAAAVAVYFCIAALRGKKPADVFFVRIDRGRNREEKDTRIVDLDKNDYRVRPPDDERRD